MTHSTIRVYNVHILTANDENAKCKDKHVHCLAGKAFLYSAEVFYST